MFEGPNTVATFHLRPHLDNFGSVSKYKIKRCVTDTPQVALKGFIQNLNKMSNTAFAFIFRKLLLLFVEIGAQIDNTLCCVASPQSDAPIDLTYYRLRLEVVAKCEGRSALALSIDLL